MRWLLYSRQEFHSPCPMRDLKVNCSGVQTDLERRFFTRNIQNAAKITIRETSKNGQYFLLMHEMRWILFRIQENHERRPMIELKVHRGIAKTHSERRFFPRNIQNAAKITIRNTSKNGQYLTFRARVEMKSKFEAGNHKRCRKIFKAILMILRKYFWSSVALQGKGKRS